MFILSIVLFILLVDVVNEGRLSFT